jgi:prevent-host-death family protein
MREIAVSKLKATCLAVIEDVRKTRKPIRVTRYGRPVAVITPSAEPSRKSWLGCMKGEFEIVGDIVGPIASIDEWTSKLR